MRKVIVAVSLAALLMVSGCGKIDNKTQVDINQPPKESIPSPLAKDYKPNSEPQQEIIYITKDVSEMSLEQRYREIVKTLEGAKKFFIDFRSKEKEDKPESWFREKREIFLRDYYHKFHVLCAKELSESEIRTSLYIAKSNSGKPVWFIEDTLRDWISEMGKNSIRPHSLNYFSNFQDMVDTFKE